MKIEFDEKDLKFIEKLENEDCPDTLRNRAISSLLVRRDGVEQSLIFKVIDPNKIYRANEFISELFFNSTRIKRDDDVQFNLKEDFGIEITEVSLFGSNKAKEIAKDDIMKMLISMKEPHQPNNNQCMTMYDDIYCQVINDIFKYVSDNM